MADLVSIITPCYNGEKYLDRYFKSLLEQTYPAIELIFVNDGSTDNTEKMAQEYGRKLIDRGYGFTYIYQENAGQCVAINKGLKLFKGKYLNWMDSDDYLTADSVSVRVRCLEDHPEVGLVIGKTILVDDRNYERMGTLEDMRINKMSSREIIEDYLRGTLINPCCSTMVRSSMFRESMPSDLQIEEVRAIGQNFQLFIPIMFGYPVKFVPDVLSFCVIHKDSHSRVSTTYEQKLHIQEVGRDTLYSIAKRLKVDEEQRRWFLSKIDEYDCKCRLNILQHHKRRDGLSEIISKMKKSGYYDAAARKMVLKIKYPVLKRLGDRLWRIKNK